MSENPKFNTNPHTRSDTVRADIIGGYQAYTKNYQTAQEQQAEYNRLLPGLEDEEGKIPMALARLAMYADEHRCLADNQVERSARDKEEYFIEHYLEAIKDARSGGVEIESGLLDVMTQGIAEAIYVGTGEELQSTAFADLEPEERGEWLTEAKAALDTIIDIDILNDEMLDRSVGVMATSKMYQKMQDIDDEGTAYREFIQQSPEQRQLHTDKLRAALGYLDPR